MKNAEENVQTEYLECQCSCMNHVINFTYYKDDNEILVSYQLPQPNNIFKRFWYAVKYICGATEQYGHWDSTLLKNEEIPTLINLLQKTQIKTETH